ncbi:hypothetical protein AWC38_SpisGene22042 [Stylophora pistillata]|uniref:ISXO2-like transposase domain-containing protein n=1 Tax=Stylophora pistillata TaxID=50429 RepID=A0A2B4RBV2_STYPI|nr:hypothetical protein AWC38_SpisGene22042 [Stylophora pistillata]
MLQYFWLVDQSRKKTMRMLAMANNLVCKVFRALEDICSMDLATKPFLPFPVRGTAVVKYDESKFNHKAKCLQPGNTVYTDDWGAYRNQHRHLPNRVTCHRIVIHSENFVDPVTDIHTQEAKLAWANFKMPLKAQRGISHDDLQAYLMIECGDSGKVLTMCYLPCWCMRVNYGLMHCVGMWIKSGKHKGLRIFRIPKIITNQGKEYDVLTRKCREKCISAVSRGDTAEKNILETERVCGRHFHQGQLAKDFNQFNPDWVTSLNLGKKEYRRPKDFKASVERFERVERRRKATIEQQEQEATKKKKLREQSSDRICDLDFESEASTSETTEDS